MNTRRRPSVAVVLSLLLPGLGHVYSGNLRTAWRAALLLAGVVAAAYACAAYLPGGSLNTIVLFGGPLAVWIAVAASAHRTARRAASDYALKPFNRWWAYATVAALFILVDQTAYRPLLYRLVARPYRSPSSSMEPTVLTGEFFFARHAPRSLSSVQRRDLIAFESVTEPGVSVMKRVVGLGGDTLQMRQDTLVVNGSAQVEPFTQHIDPGGDAPSPDMVWQASYLLPGVDRLAYRPSRSNWGPIVVPPNRCFVLGDNRHNSYDSRYWGFVPADRIRGRALRVYFSYDAHSWKVLPFLTAIRWRRLGKALT